jgi:phosphoserine phosphatase
MQQHHSFPTKQTHVVTLIAKPEVMPLSQPELDTVIDALQANGAVVEAVEWLGEGEAADIYFAVLPMDDAKEVLEYLLEEVPFDAIVQSALGRKKKLLICDMDSTMIEQECIDEIAAFAGVKEKIAAITARAMNGELDFKAALRERVGMLAGLPETVLQEVYDKHITFMSGGRELVQTMKANGARAVLVSGGFTFFTSRVAEHLGFDIQEANILEIAEGKLTGNVREPILDKEAKLNALCFHADELNIRQSDVVAVGDGANDLPMLKAAGLGVAAHAKPSVRAQANAQINHCDLRAVLYAQGYKAEEFVR